MHFFNITGGASVTLDILLPDAWSREKKQSGKAVWLLHDANEASGSWVSCTQAEVFANQYGVALIAPSMGRLASYRDSEPGCTWETFFAKGLWEYVHEILPALSAEPEDHLLFGRGAGGEAAKRFAAKYPRQYGQAVACGTDWLACNDTLRQAIAAFAQNQDK